MSDQIPSSEFPAAMPSVPMTPAPAPVSILQTWMNAITKPRAATYAAIAASPNATRTNAFLWISVSSLIQSFVVLLVGSGDEAGILQGLGQGSPSVNIGSRITQAVSAAPFSAGLEVLGFAIFVWLVNAIARGFGGHATFAQMAYTLAAISVPMSLLSSILSLLGAIPYVGFCFLLLALPLGLYALALDVIAVKAVHNIAWGGALVASLLMPVVLLVGIACLVIAVLMVLGPVIGNAFSTINSSLP